MWELARLLPDQAAQNLIEIHIYTCITIKHNLDLEYQWRAQPGGMLLSADSFMLLSFSGRFCAQNTGVLRACESWDVKETFIRKDNPT